MPSVIQRHAIHVVGPDHHFLKVVAPLQITKSATATGMPHLICFRHPQTRRTTTKATRSRLPGLQPIHFSNQSLGNEDSRWNIHRLDVLSLNDQPASVAPSGTNGARHFATIGEDVVPQVIRRHFVLVTAPITFELGEPSHPSPLRCSDG